MDLFTDVATKMEAPFHATAAQWIDVVGMASDNVKLLAKATAPETLFGSPCPWVIELFRKKLALIEG